MALLKTFANDADAGYGFEWLRALLELSRQEGVLDVTDFKVVPAGAGGNRVDVMAGKALVKGDSGLAALGITQGLYLQINDALIANAVTFDPGGAQPRLDQVVLEVNDSSDLGSAGEAPRIYVLKGAEVGGTTLDNGYTNGSAAALPANTLRLADRLAPAGTNTLVATDLRDRRKWARGARALAQTATGAHSLTATTLAQVDAALPQRVECSGAPVVIEFTSPIVQVAAATAITWRFVPTVDGTDVMGAPDNWQGQSNNNGIYAPEVMRFVTTPAAGSRLFDLKYLVIGGNVNLQGKAQFSVLEDLRPLTNNN